MILGGTGMLAGCTATLVAEGWHVVVPSRRYSPIRADRPGGSGAQALWVETDWSDPRLLAKRAGRALGGPADLLVAWVHEQYRPAVLTAVAPLLRAGAPVVEVLGSGAADPVSGCPEPELADHPAQQVVLGLIREGEATRWLNDEEVRDGVLAAVRRALAGRPPSVFQVGDAPPLAFQW